MKKPLFKFFVTFICCGLNLPAFATTYSVTDLGRDGYPYAINNSGQVVGQMNLHPFLYSNGSAQDLGSLITLTDPYNSNAIAINNIGQVIVNSGGHGFLYSNGIMQDLGGPSRTSTNRSGTNSNGQVVDWTYSNIGSTSVYGINDNGLIVGVGNGYYGVNSSGYIIGFLDSNGTIQNLGNLGRIEGPGGNVGSMTVTGINNSGQIIGTSGFSNSGSGRVITHPFLYSNGTMQDLTPSLGAASYPKAINNIGQIVGYYYFQSAALEGPTHAFLYSNGSLQDLGTLNGSAGDSFAYAINNNGQVVGYSRASSEGALHAFIYENGQMQDLNTLLEPSSGAGYSIWSLDNMGINDNGWITITALKNGEVHAVLLKPITATTSAVSPKDLGGSLDYPNACMYTGNPIHIGVGNKFLNLNDYTAQGNYPLYLNSSYNSLGGDTSLAANWRLTWMGYGVQSNSTTKVTVNRPDGKGYLFSLVNNAWKTDADITEKLETITNSGGTAIGWRYTAADGDIEVYNTTGKLTSLTNRAGWIWTLTTTGVATTVSDPLGRSLVFSTDSQGNTVVTDPSGGTLTYHKDGNSNLTSVTFQDGKVKTYLYENPSYPHALTGIIDENGDRYATYQYDSSGRAYDEELAPDLGLPAGQEIEHNTLNYNVDGSGNPTSTVVTDARGSSRTYNFTTILGVTKVTGQSQPAGSGCPAAAAAITYDANGNVATRTDFNGNQTTYTYDLTRNLETSRTEGLTSSGTSTAATRTITTTWHSTWRLPLVITEYTGATASGTALHKTTYTYDTKGNVTSIAENDPVNAITQTTTITYTYSTLAPGLILTKVVNGPRTDVNDSTTYTYYPSNANCSASTSSSTAVNLGCRGQLQSITNALGQVTTFPRYNHHGQVELMKDPNNKATTNTYDARQRLLTSVVNGVGMSPQTTTLTYDDAGQITQLKMPDNSTLNYTYDAAHRLTQVQDTLGNKVVYTLDSEGNRTNEQTYDPAGSLTKTISRSYDALNRLQTLTGQE